MVRRLAALALLVLVGGCTTPPEPVAGRDDGASATGRPASRPPLSAEAQRALARRGIQPHDTAPLTIGSRCSHVDEAGTSTRLTLDVDRGAVGSFDADVSIRGRGRCRFSLADYRQEAREPQVLLRHRRDSQCTVRMWREQQDKMAIAFTGCPRSCEGNAFDYLWPILVDAKTGQCF